MTTAAGLRDACAIARGVGDGCARSRQKLRVRQAFPNCEPPPRIAYCRCIFTLRKEMTMTLARLRIAVAALALGATPALAQDKVRFQTDWIPSGEHAMYYGGWQKGIFAAEGIDITITRGYGSGDTVTKLAGGGFDFGVADMAAVITARARQNVPVKTIAVLYTQSPHSLFVLKSSGITSFKGLEGKKIGITPGNSHKFYFPKVAERAGTDPNKITWVSMDGAAMAAQLIAKNLDAAPFYSIHHYYQNKAAKAAGEDILVLPFVEVGFKIFAATIIASDKIVAEKPDLTKRFLRAVKKSFEFARDNPEETCKLHIQKIPEVALDDCMGSVRATMAFVYNDHTDKFGWGKESPERLEFTWKAIADAQELDPKWEYKQAIDTSLLEK
jgi:NitT/TauT family transport system substrate-binding protein